MVVQSLIINKLICGCAGIGRLASLRCLCVNARTGSSPVIRTSKAKKRHPQRTEFCARLFSFLPVGMLFPMGQGGTERLRKQFLISRKSY